MTAKILITTLRSQSEYKHSAVYTYSIELGTFSIFFGNDKSFCLFFILCRSRTRIKKSD